MYKAKSVGQEVLPGDWVRDPMDGDQFRQIEHIDGNTVYMTDGGFIGLNEITAVYLESEVIK